MPEDYAVFWDIVRLNPDPFVKSDRKLHEFSETTKSRGKASESSSLVFFSLPFWTLLLLPHHHHP